MADVPAVPVAALVPAVPAVRSARRDGGLVAIVAAGGQEGVQVGSRPEAQGGPVPLDHGKVRLARDRVKQLTQVPGRTSGVALGPEQRVEVASLHPPSTGGQHDPQRRPARGS
jgi:hypothetical protein